jgi:phosphoglycolate phosphatase-like HAD superfamily hydrolase
VLFDLDGTLIDLRAAYLRAHQLAARDVLAVELEEARILELMATGVPIRTHMALLDELAAEALVESFVAHYRREREGLARPFPGMTGLLRDLRNRGFRVAVVTSKLREDTIAELAATALDESVELVVAFEDTEQHKPAAAPHLEALRRLGATDGVGVGDLPGDVLSARRAGLAAIGVTWGYGTETALREAGAMHVCETAVELARELDRRLSSRPTAGHVAER